MSDEDSPPEGPADEPRTSEELHEAADALSAKLGADPDYAVLAAVERLTELHAAGVIGKEDYERERRRLTGGG